jgi:hypothetical protein
MTEPFVHASRKEPAAPRGAQKRPQVRKGGECTKGRTRIAVPDESNLSEDQRVADSGGEVSTDSALEGMNETLRRLHRTQPKPRRFDGVKGGTGD